MSRFRPPQTAARALAILALLLAVPALLSGCAIGRGIEALSVLGDIGARQGAVDGSLPGVLRTALSSGPDDGPARPGHDAPPSGPHVLHAELYRPMHAETGEALPSRAALLLVPGLAETGKDDPRVVALAASLARAGIAVMVPDLVSLRELRAGPDNVDEIARALRFLAGDASGLWAAPSRPTAGHELGARPVGVAAVSYAVGPALLATMTPQLAGRVDFLVGVGGYYDMTAALAFATTGWYRDVDGSWVRGAPNVYGKWAFMQANAARVDDPADRTTLAAMARRRLADPAAPVGDLAAALGPEGRSVHELVANQDPARVPALIDALPPGIRDDLMALDVSAYDLTTAPPHVLLLHGRDDAILPASESVALAAALGPGRTHLALVSRMAHAEFGVSSIADLYRLWRAVYWLLAVRDGAA